MNLRAEFPAMGSFELSATTTTYLNQAFLKNFKISSSCSYIPSLTVVLPLFNTQQLEVTWQSGHKIVVWIAPERNCSVPLVQLQSKTSRSALQSHACFKNSNAYFDLFVRRKGESALLKT